MRLLLLFIAACIILPVLAGPVSTYQFETVEQEAAFKKLSNELRCLVCQNQSIADSNAGLAKDLRDEIFAMLQKGMNEDEVIDFMVQRYGDFVLYRPPVKPLTWLLWFGPAIVLLAGFVFAVRVVRKQDETHSAEALSEHDVERLKQLQADSSSTTRPGEDKHR